MFEVMLGLVVFATILAPGLVFRRFQARFLVLADAASEKVAILDIALAGLLLTVLTVPIYSLIGITPVTSLWLAETPKDLIAVINKVSFGLLFHCFVIPVYSAVVVAYLERSGMVSSALTTLGLVPMSKHPSAFATAFLAHREISALCSVTLKDGSVVYGQFGAEAAVTTTSEQDVFLDALYIPSEDGDLVLEEDSTGILIKGDQVVTIVFSTLPIPAPEDLEDSDDLDKE